MKFSLFIFSLHLPSKMSRSGAFPLPGCRLKIKAYNLYVLYFRQLDHYMFTISNIAFTNQNRNTDHRGQSRASSFFAFVRFCPVLTAISLPPHTDVEKLLWIDQRVSSYPDHQTLCPNARREKEERHFISALYLLTPLKR